MSRPEVDPTAGGLAGAGEIGSAPARTSPWLPLGNLTAGFIAAFLKAPLVLVMDGLVLVIVGTIVLLRHSTSGVTSL